MYYLPYAIPIVGLVVAFFFNLDPDNWWVYLLVTAFAEGIIVIMFYFFSRAEEYLSGYVVQVVHLNAWKEKVVEKETKYDEKGNSYTKEKVRYVEHPDEWLWYLNTGREQNIPKYLFREMCQRWQTTLHYFETYHHNCVSGGGGQRCNWNGNEFDTRTITYTHKYKNPVRYSQSLYKSNFIDNVQVRKLGLFEYPGIGFYDDQKVILYDATLSEPRDYERANSELQRLNAFMGSKHEIHVFILLFQAEKGIEVAQKQRDYWKGLNKNEFVVCLGVSGQKVKWCDALSWMDLPTLGLKTRDYFIAHKDLDLVAFVRWLRTHLDSWKRKEFKDFKYLGTNMSEENGTLYWIISLVLGVLVFAVCLCFR